MAGRTRDTGLDDHLFFTSTHVRTHQQPLSRRGVWVPRESIGTARRISARVTYVRTPLWARQTGSCHGSSLSCIKGTCGFLFRAPNLVFGPRSGAAASKIFLLYSRQLSMS